MLGRLIRLVVLLTGTEYLNATNQSVLACKESTKFKVVLTNVLSGIWDAIISKQESVNCLQGTPYQCDNPNLNTEEPL